MKYTLFLLTILGTAAQAATINLFSSAATTTNNTLSPTLNIAPHPAWAAALAGSNWVSFAITGNPAAPGYQVVPNGTVVTFEQDFSLSSAAYAGSISVMADDTTSVDLNGHVLYAAANPAGGYPVCSADPIGCLATTRKDFTFADLQPYLKVGQNAFKFGVVQKNAVAFGLDYAGSVTNSPEPASLALIGGGLIVLALKRRRAPKLAV